MDGLLIIDKPAGPTSHDVVSRMRRTLREKRMGHTGTLDPAATGVLLLVLGRATRLAQFLSASDKSYEAVVRLGFATDTADAQGQPIGPVSHAAPPPVATIDAALNPFRGTFLQQPPAFSAKKIEGKRSHQLARARSRASAEARTATDNTAATERASGDGPQLVAATALPAAASVTTHRLEIVGIDGAYITLRVDCSAGFYVRSLAHDLGERLGMGAHLAALRRTRIGDFTIDQAMDFDAAERDATGAAEAVIPLAHMLPRFAAVTLTADGVLRAVHGREIRPADAAAGFGAPRADFASSEFIRLLDQQGALVGIATSAATPGFLHPSVVLV